MELPIAIPSLATSAVEPTASAPSARTAETAAAIATTATTQPSLRIRTSAFEARDLTALSASHNRRGRATLAHMPPHEHQRHPLVEREACLEPQSLHPIGDDRRRCLRGEQ